MVIVHPPLAETISSSAGTSKIKSWRETHTLSQGLGEALLHACGSSNPKGRLFGRRFHGVQDRLTSSGVRAF